MDDPTWFAIVQDFQMLANYVLYEKLDRNIQYLKQKYVMG